MGLEEVGDEDPACRAVLDSRAETRKCLLPVAGGKGVATCCGVCLALSWPAGLIGFGLWIGITALTRYVSLASMIATGCTWALVWLFGGSAPAVLAIAFVGVLSIAQHRSNIKRLLAGTESKIGQRAKLPPSDADAPGATSPEEAGEA